jgi:hypothetical protein
LKVEDNMMRMKLNYKIKCTMNRGTCALVGYLLLLRHAWTGLINP